MTRSKYMKIQEFVRRARKRARKAGCDKCHKHKEVGLNHSPRLTEMSRGGSTLDEIKEAIRSRGWFCRTCVSKREGTTAAAPMRDQYDMTDPAQATAFHQKSCSMEPYAGKMRRMGYVLNWNQTKWLTKTKAEVEAQDLAQAVAEGQ